MIGMVLLAVATAQPAPPSMPTTIAEIHANPRAWDGKWVRIEGWINRCSRDCSLAEHLAARPINQGMTLSFEGQKNFDAWAKPMLPIHAWVVARFDAACLIDICLGRAPELRQMRVEAIESKLNFPDEDR